MSKKIYDIMNKHVLTINLSTPFTTACRMFENFRFRHLPVVGDDGGLIGMYSIIDAMAVLNSRIMTNQDLDEKSINRMISVQEVMSSRNVYTIQASHCMEKGIACFQKHQIHSLVVIEDDKIVGILTPTDVLKNIDVPSKCFQC